MIPITYYKIFVHNMKIKNYNEIICLFYIHFTLYRVPNKIHTYKCFNINNLLQKSKSILGTLYLRN